MTSASGVSAAELAALLDVDEQTVRRLARRRLVIRLGHGRYALGPSIKAYVTHLREEATKRMGADETIDAIAEGAQLSRAKRQWYQLKNEQFAAGLVMRDDLPSAWRGLVGVIRAMESKILTRIRLEMPQLTAFDHSTMSALIRQQLDDAGITDEMPAIQI